MSEIELHGSPAFLYLIHDIDELKRTENAVKEANEQLNLLNSITRHDIKNKVMVISGYSEVLRKTTTDPSALDKVAKILKAGKEIQHLIEFTKEYQDLGAGQPVWLSLDEIIEEINTDDLLSGISLSLSKENILIRADPIV